MLFIDSQTLVIPGDGTVVGLNQSQIDRTGCSRAYVAKIQVRGGAVVYAFGKTPIGAGVDGGTPGEGFLAEVGTEFTIYDYDNLKSVLFTAQTTTTVSLYVVYGT